MKLKRRTISRTRPGSHADIDSILTSLTTEPVSSFPLVSGLSVVAFEDGEIVYEKYSGNRCIDVSGFSGNLPVMKDTKFRVASMSKPVTCIGAMQLVERGLLDLTRDISDYLGFRLRHPLYPDNPITAEMLLSHLSSLRDGCNYTIPFGGRLEDMFSPENPLYEDGAHFASPVPGRSPAEIAPGCFFEYCNLNFGILATVMERLSGERFDLYMKKHVLDPLGIEAAYNINLLGDAAFDTLGVLYRKAPGSEGPWDSSGAWIPQTDDYRGKRPALALRYMSGPQGQAPDLADYAIGSNGTMFSPQGGLRISIRDYAKILRIFMEGGCCGAIRILEGQSVRDMMTPRWRYDPAAANGNSYYGMTRESGLALFHTTDSRDDMGCDLLVPQGGVKMWGHHGDAFGYLGAGLFDPDTGCGLVYGISGTADDPMIHRGSYSSWFIWEELIQKTVLEGIFGYGVKARCAATDPRFGRTTAQETPRIHVSDKNHSYQDP